MDRQQIAFLKQQLKTEYEKNLEAIERVEKLLTATSGEQMERRPSVSGIAPKAVQTQESSTPTLIGEVENWFRWLPDQTWTVKQLVEKMREKAFEFTSDEPQKSVQTAVWRLEKNGVIRTVVRGAGRRPSTYRLAEQEIQSAINGNG